MTRKRMTAKGKTSKLTEAKLKFYAKLYNLFALITQWCVFRMEKLLTEAGYEINIAVIVDEEPGKGESVYVDPDTGETRFYN